MIGVGRRHRLVATFALRPAAIVLVASVVMPGCERRQPGATAAHEIARLGGEITIASGSAGRPRTCVRFPRPVPFADRNVRLLKSLENLSKLSLANTQITDAGLADVIQKVVEIWLSLI
jgi:hypothetical protein